MGLVLLVWAGWLPSGWGASGSQPVGTMPSSASEREGFSIQVERALSIEVSGADVLPAFRGAIRSINESDATKKAQAINSLVATILKGPDATVLTNKIAINLDIDTKTFPPLSEKEWGLGKMSEWRVLGDNLWNLSVAAQKRDAKKASELAKASIMVSAMDDFFTDWLPVANRMASPETEGVLGIPHEEFIRLKKLVEKRMDEHNLWAREAVAGLKLIDAITEAKAAKVAPETVREIMAHIDKAFREGPDQLGYRLKLIRYTWTFLNLLKTKSDAELPNFVRRQFEEWKRDFRDPNIERWITQALTREGPVPVKLVSERKVK
jgi:hypothetical protein